MTKLKYRGYKEKKVEVREITIAELKLLIIQSYIEKVVREVTLVDITEGETTTFKTIEDVIKNDWAGDCKIEIINMPHGWGTEEENKTVIIFQLADIEEDKVIA